MDVEQIQSELIKKSFPVIKVAQMTSFRTKNKLPLYQIQLTNGPVAKEIFNLDNLLYHIINVGNYNRPPLPPPRDAMFQLPVHGITPVMNVKWPPGA